MRLLLGLALAGICLLTYPKGAAAQSSIGGIINIYTPVLQITTDACAALLEVEDTTGFRAGDRVLLHQTMGCTGATDYTVDAVGLFEFATIERIRPNRIIELKRTLVHSYQRCNFVQLVRVPSYNGTTSVTSVLRGKPWDGKGGGIIALEVKGVLNLRNTIDASSIGYQGGAAVNSPNGQCSTMIANTTLGNPDAAMKGATFVYPRIDNVAGSAELFSAGGGGLGHNSGGGGGGNGGRGGNGGSQWQGCNALIDNGGRGGASFPIQFNGMPYVRFGGGGGAGHTNNSTGSSGAVGGGIVIIKADTIYGNQNIIQALGASAQTSGNDGAGGGGAGGCVLISTSFLAGPLHINVNGGQGGNMSNSGLHGPGGGGGGGGVLYSGISLPSGITFSAEGGLSGKCTAITDAVRAAHLAKPGNPGSIAFRAIIPENTSPKPVLGVTINSDTTICPNQTVTLTLRTIGSVANIEWRELGGKVLGSSSVLDVQPPRTTSYIVSVSDATGCQALDTATVRVLEGWKAQVLPLNLGDVFCDKIIDTTLLVVNLGTVPGFISNITFANANTSLIDTLPKQLAARDTARVRVRIVTGSVSGPNSALVSVTLSPCDTVVSTLITWNRQNRLNTISPRTVVMPELYTCTGVSRDTVLVCKIQGSSGVVTNVVTTGSVSSTSALPIVVADGQTVPIALRWTPTSSQSKGRAGVVLQFEGCSDTLWIDVDGVVQMPRMAAPDTVSVPDVLICATIPQVVDIPLVSIDSTTWFIDEVITPSEVVLSAVRGDSLRGSRTIQASVLPNVLGPFTYTVRIRLIPCDTTVVVVLTGTAIDADLTNADTVVFTQPIIGKTELRSISFVNSGSVPIDVVSVEPLAPRPFALVRSKPAIPCTIAPGDTLTCDIEITQRYGKHLDSLIVVTTNPCEPRAGVVLVSEAYATTTLYMPDIESEIGADEMIPVLMDGRPMIDSTLLDSFELEIAVQVQDLAVRNGSDVRSVWTCTSTNTRSNVVIRGRWLGGDTLAHIPMRTLLSSSTSTPLSFVTMPGFEWIGQQCDVIYRNGSVILGDVCSGRTVRLVSIGQNKPIVLSPNPVSSIVHLRPHQDIIKGPYLISIYDQLGNTMMTTPGAGPVSVDVSNLNAGMYVVRITDASNVYSEPLIKQ
jgi:hypothetical protein